MIHTLKKEEGHFIPGYPHFAKLHVVIRGMVQGHRKWFSRTIEVFDGDSEEDMVFSAARWDYANSMKYRVFHPLWKHGWTIHIFGCWQAPCLIEPLSARDTRTMARAWKRLHEK